MGKTHLGSLASLAFSSSGVSNSRTQSSPSFARTSSQDSINMDSIVKLFENPSSTPPPSLHP